MSHPPGLSAIPVGPIDFKIVDIDPKHVALSLQAYLERGSKLTGVSLDDISRRVCRLPTKDEPLTLSLLTSLGMKLFDAIVLLSAGCPDSHPLEHDATMTTDSIPNAHAIAKAVFYVYFFLLTQARYPATGSSADPPKTAAFLTGIMGMTDPQSTYMQRICSFTPQKFDAKWIKFIKFSGLGQEAMSRFGLGVAGYRLFGPFKAYKIREGLSAELIAAATFAKNVAEAPPTWAIHPVTRDPAVLSKRGNLNKNLGNLILEVFTEAQIAEMVTAKMLYNTPVKAPNYRNYLTWAADDNISGPDRIFLLEK